jgi:putative iron-dependent peroxidase
MSYFQPEIIAPLPPHAIFLTFEAKPGTSAKPALQSLQAIYKGGQMLVGIGQVVAEHFGCVIDELKPMPSLSCGAITIPVSHGALWVRVRGDDPGEAMFRAQTVIQAVSDAFELVDSMPGFTYRKERDLSGYIDGTENPQDDDAIAAAIVDSDETGINGSSFVAVQRWVHNLAHLKGMPQSHQDHIIGRRLSDNEELDDAPISAHVKRTAQESFSPEAFMVRRSLPWAKDNQCGLQFISFAHSFYPFEVQLKRMIGLEDGVTDGLFEFSRPVTGGYFWCPPMDDEGLDLSALF